MKRLAYNRERYLKNKKKHRLACYKWQLRAYYNLEYEDYKIMREKQNFSCAICHTPEESLSRRLEVDHCHATDKVRGLLCTKCNRALGYFYDNIDLLINAAFYLRKPLISPEYLPQRLLKEKASSKVCRENGCNRIAQARGLCHTHYEWHRRHTSLSKFPTVRKQRYGSKREKRRQIYWDDPTRWREEAKEDALLRKYGIDMIGHETLSQSQLHVCYICRKPDLNRRLAVDHDHQTGKIRGLLCTTCNKGLGFLDDDLTKITSAINYLIRS